MERWVGTKIQGHGKKTTGNYIEQAMGAMTLEGRVVSERKNIRSKDLLLNKVHVRRRS